MLRLRSTVLLLAFSTILGACASTPEFGARRAPSAAGFFADESEADRLQDAIAAKRVKVAEFRFIQEWAEAHGYRAWIAGGSAAGYAHYVKAEIERALGPGRYLDSRFGYKYFQIFRSTQDADVVIDTGEAEAVALEKALKEKFDYLQGSKSAWEIRLLQKPRGSGAGLKEPLIDNPNFRNQNSDSHSTGMIELTDPPRNESVVRDLFDWDEHRAPPFLADVAEGKLHFYANALHATTSRARAGLNPEILSVIRYFTKAFQYGLDIREEDIPAIRRIIDGFDPTDPALASARGQIENNAKKLYAHAEDLERAYRTLERFGLRRKLLAFGGAPAPGRMSGLLDRVPLLSQALGTEGRKASEIFGLGRTIVVSHETNDLLAYESITRSRRGLPNVLISRKGGVGETAIHGDGFYTKVGREGARGTGLTIRFELHPEAREGHDFIYVEKDGYVVVRNRGAIRVIDESIEMKPLDFFHFVSNAGFSPSDLGLWKMMATVIQSDLSGITAAEREAILDLAIETLEKDVHSVWIANFLFPNASLRDGLRRRLLALPPKERGAIGLRFWSRSDPGENTDPLDDPALKPWREFLAESDAFTTTRERIGPALDRILESPVSEKITYVFPPLLPKECYSVENALAHLLHYARMAEGEAGVRARLAALDFERKTKALILINEAVSHYGERRSSDKHHYLYEWVRDAFLADPDRPADFHKQWNFGKIRSGLYEVRFRLGPISEAEIQALLAKNLHGWSELHPVERALEEALRSGDSRSVRSAAEIALRLAESGNMAEIKQRPIFVRILIQNADRIPDASTLVAAKTAALDFIDASIRRYSSPQYHSIDDYVAAFLIDAFASPQFFDEERWLELLEVVRSSGKAYWKGVLGGILVAGHAANPYFRNRADLVASCFDEGQFKFASWGIPREVQDRGLRGLVRDYPGLIGEKIRSKELTRGQLHKIWLEGCPGLLAK